VRARESPDDPPRIMGGRLNKLVALNFDLLSFFFFFFFYSKKAIIFCFFRVGVVCGLYLRAPGFLIKPTITVKR
jgi:hypothetical protein